MSILQPDFTMPHHHSGSYFYYTKNTKQCTSLSCSNDDFIVHPRIPLIPYSRNGSPVNFKGDFELITTEFYYVSQMDFLKIINEMKDKIFYIGKTRGKFQSRFGGFAVNKVIFTHTPKLFIVYKRRIVHQRLKPILLACVKV